MAMFVGYAADGFFGVLIALMGALLPPTVIMLTVVSVLSQFHGEAWLNKFIKGMGPAVGVLIALVSYQILRSDVYKAIGKKAILIAALAFIALFYNLPSPLVLLGAGILGVLILK